MAALVGGLLGSIISGNQGLESVAGPVLGMLLAFPLGVGLGMGFIAYRLRHHKRPWLGVAGAIVGFLLILLLAEPNIPPFRPSHVLRQHLIDRPND